MESRETELCSKLYKTKEEQQIFLGFSNIKPKIENKANQS
jgi:hypothetical protein